MRHDYTINSDFNQGSTQPIWSLPSSFIAQFCACWAQKSDVGPSTSAFLEPLLVRRCRSDGRASLGWRRFVSRGGYMVFPTDVPNYY